MKASKAKARSVNGRSANGHTKPAPMNSIPSRVVPIDSIQPHPRNYNAHSDNQIADLAASAQNFTQVKNIVVWRGKIIAGEGLWRGMQKAGASEIEIKDVSKWSETKALAFMAADNEIARRGQPDQDALANIVRDVMASGEQLALQQLLARGTERIVSDPLGEWGGMPEFEQKDLTAFKSIVVHFGLPEHLKAFAKLVGQPLTEQTKSIWYPKAEKTNMTDIYVES